MRLIILLFIFISSCNYPDVDDIPENQDLEITTKDRINIFKLIQSNEEND
ncbi:MAG: hypothetical protein CFH21_00521 [Alphaproteobacteria bacterium MarineAlpha5_Bin11]|nr:MAG: hypothetical protein CFH21_00521 [Alphaproteobacteria bacterium MarineAlpha5_Bin11]|tara:strand:- start:353 stop:502 length:150 start_codon:yes stop_codon:yes gene_type:complete